MRKCIIFFLLVFLCNLNGWAQEEIPQEEQIEWVQDETPVIEVVEAVPQIIESPQKEASRPFSWLHYLIIFAIIVVIVYFQTTIYKDTIKKISVFENIFSSKRGSYSFGISKTNFSKGISSSHFNPVFNEIEDAINNYLSNNKGSVSDYHLMKDIVDRNCDAKEEEINTQIPVPLYLGLMGTMAGILIGIGYLLISGDLSDLLNAENSKSGAAGVKALLGGVALAMISSILGIILTTLGSMKAKDAKVKEERNKHVFLSWMQANMLPNLSNDTAQTLERMSANLVNFNKTFSNNTKELGSTLQQVNEATTLQKQLLEAVEKLADKNISKQNLDLYNALRNSSQEIAALGSFLHDSNQYLAQVRELNEKLDRNENRTKAIEETAEFFKKEIGQIAQRKEAINKAVGEVDSRLEETFRKLTDDSNRNIEAFQQALGKQQDALQKKLAETQVIVDELKNLSSIKESISKFEKATVEQDRKIDSLSAAILQLGESRLGKRSVIVSLPKWIKVSIIALAITSFISCSILLLLVLYDYFVV